MSTLIIGLGYKARRGKDTAARAIIEARGKQFDIRRYAFADALKREVNTAAETAGGMLALFTQLATHGAPLPNGATLQFPEWVGYDRNADMTDPLCPLGKQRKLLQWWGTDYRRNRCDRFYWVRRLKEQLELEQPQVALLTDLRFQNEFLWVKANGGFTVRVDRAGFTDLSSEGHTSEHELDGVTFDFNIEVADGSVDELKSDSVTVFDMILNLITPQVDVHVAEEDVEGTPDNVGRHVAGTGPDNGSDSVSSTSRESGLGDSERPNGVDTTRPFCGGQETNRNRRGVRRVVVTEYAGSSFANLIRRYAYDRMGRDSKYRNEVLQRLKSRKKESAA